MTDFESMKAANENVLRDFDRQLANAREQVQYLETQRAVVQAELDRLERFLAHEKASV